MNPVQIHNFPENWDTYEIREDIRKKIFRTLSEFPQLKPRLEDISIVRMTNDPARPMEVIVNTGSNLSQLEKEKIKKMVKDIFPERENTRVVVI